MEKIHVRQTKGVILKTSPVFDESFKLFAPKMMLQAFYNPCYVRAVNCPIAAGMNPATSDAVNPRGPIFSFARSPAAP